MEEPVAQTHSVFDPIRNRRNRVVHFHADHTRDIGDRVGVAIPVSSPSAINNTDRDEFVLEVCLAWYEMHNLLTGLWKEKFKLFEDHIAATDKQMMDVWKYLETRFEKLKSEIEALRRNGEVIKCVRCGFEACQRQTIFGGLESFACLVCRRNERVLTLDFHFGKPQCRGPVSITQNSDCICTKCDEEIPLDVVLSELSFAYNPSGPDYRVTGICDRCMANVYTGGTVVRLENEVRDEKENSIQIDYSARFVCLHCLADFDMMHKCEYCGQAITGDVSDTYLYGCGACEGRSGQIRDD